MSRLSNAGLARLPAGVARPNYERAKLQASVVHLGLGAFHRAHQAVYFDELAKRGDLRFGVTGVSLRSEAVRQQLLPQDGLYTLVVRASEQRSLRVIGSLKDVLVAPQNPRAVLAALTAATTRLVTLSITEKGYKLKRETGELDLSDPDVIADCSDLSAPRTAPGLLVAALRQRRALGLPAFSVISCDNLPQNGRLLAKSVTALAAQHDAALADWLLEHGVFPCSMVDRIVPATVEADLAQVNGELGMADLGMVKTEPFTQWVVEEHAADYAEAFQSVGIQWVQDVAAWERVKLRLLNGAHSAIAYLGGLAQLTCVHEFVAEPWGRAFIERLFQQVEPVLAAPAELDVVEYQRALLERFLNPALGHRCAQIAIDGSQKLPQRLLAPLSELKARQAEVECLLLATAAWIEWCRRCSEGGANAPSLNDPLAHEIQVRVRGVVGSSDVVANLLSLASVFTPELSKDATLQAQLVKYLELLRQSGPRAAVAACLSS